MSRPFKLTVSVVSETEGQVQQNIIVEEYSDTAEEHVLKNFTVGEAVVSATSQAMAELAAAGGFQPGLKPKK